MGHVVRARRRSPTGSPFEVSAYFLMAGLHGGALLRYSSIQSPRQRRPPEKVCSSSKDYRGKTTEGEGRDARIANRGEDLARIVALSHTHFQAT
ncbi:hypothetical protein BN2475_170004 [Paraburkholderia ribeironis]|uniref:Uncharacterized protein n=1 Tax=Paraburkholderia ribeironis TaxID=1247936 RepID=A0A1N7RUC2_9BURK|nr:hypothetical protein BN2475_170004 [Paraburkholderia ribeironis]